MKRRHQPQRSSSAHNRRFARPSSAEKHNLSEEDFTSALWLSKERSQKSPLRPMTAPSSPHDLASGEEEPPQYATSMGLWSQALKLNDGTGASLSNLMSAPKYKGSTRERPPLTAPLPPPLQNLATFFVKDEEADEEGDHMTNDGLSFLHFVALTSAGGDTRKELSVRMIQRLWRRRMAKRHLERLRKGMQEYMDNQVMYEHAWEIQRFWKSTRVVARLLRRRNAAKKIQRLYRHSVENPTLNPLRLLGLRGVGKCVLIEDWAHDRIAEAWRQYQNRVRRTEASRFIQRIGRGALSRVIDLPRRYLFLRSLHCAARFYLSAKLRFNKYVVHSLQLVTSALRARGSRRALRNHQDRIAFLLLKRSQLARQAVQEGIAKAMLLMRVRAIENRMHQKQLVPILEMEDGEQPTLAHRYQLVSAYAALRISARFRGFHARKQQAPLRPLCQGYRGLSLLSSIQRNGTLRWISRVREHEAGALFRAVCHGFRARQECRQLQIRDELTRKTVAALVVKAINKVELGWLIMQRCSRGFLSRRLLGHRRVLSLLEALQRRGRGFLSRRIVFHRKVFLLREAARRTLADSIVVKAINKVGKGWLTLQKCGRGFLSRRFAFHRKVDLLREAAHRILAEKAREVLRMVWQGYRLRRKVFTSFNILRIARVKQMKRMRVLAVVGLTSHIDQSFPNLSLVANCLCDAFATKIQTLWRCVLARGELEKLRKMRDDEEKRKHEERLQKVRDAEETRRRERSHIDERRRILDEKGNVSIRQKPAWVPTTNARRGIARSGWHDDEDLFDMRKSCFQLLGIPSLPMEDVFEGTEYVDEEKRKHEEILQKIQTVYGHAPKPPRKKRSPAGPKSKPSSIRQTERLTTAPQPIPLTERLNTAPQPFPVALEGGSRLSPPTRARTVQRPAPEPPIPMPPAPPPVPYTQRLQQSLSRTAHDAEAKALLWRDRLAEMSQEYKPEVRMTAEQQREVVNRLFSQSLERERELMQALARKYSPTREADPPQRVSPPRQPINKYPIRRASRAIHPVTATAPMTRRQEELLLGTRRNSERKDSSSLAPDVNHNNSCGNGIITPRPPPILPNPNKDSRGPNQKEKVKTTLNERCNKTTQANTTLPELGK